MIFINMYIDKEGNVYIRKISPCEWIKRFLASCFKPPEKEKSFKTFKPNCNPGG